MGKGHMCGVISILVSIAFMILYFLLFESSIVNYLYFLALLLPIFFLFRSTSIQQDFFEFSKLWEAKALLVLGFITRCFLSLWNSSHLNYHMLTMNTDFLNVLNHETPDSITYRLFFYPLLEVTHFLEQIFDIDIQLRLHSLNLLVNLLAAVFIYLTLKRLTQNKSISLFGFILFLFSPIQIRYAASDSAFNLIVLFNSLLIYLALVHRDTGDRYVFFSLPWVLAFSSLLRPEQFLICIPFGIFTYLIGFKKSELFHYLTCSLIVLAGGLSLKLKTIWNVVETLFSGRELGAVGIHYTNKVSSLIQNILIPFSSEFIYFIPLYALFFISFLFLTRHRKFFKISLGVFIWYLYYLVVVPSRFDEIYVQSFLYLSHTEIFVILILSLGFVVLKSMNLNWKKNWLEVIVMILIVVTVAWNGRAIVQLYDEQLEYTFFRSNVEKVMSAKKIYILNWTEGDEFGVKNSEFKGLLKADQFAAMAGLKRKTPGPDAKFEELDIRDAREYADKNVLFYRSIRYGVKGYEMDPSQFEPVLVKSFLFQPRFPSYLEGSQIEYGLYKHRAN